MKKTISMFTAMLLLCAIFALPVHAAEEIKSSHYYPISVDEYIGGDFDEPRIQKVYQLSLDDEPAKIPTEDFVRNGRLYYLLDMTRQDEIGGAILRMVKRPVTQPRPATLEQRRASTPLATR